MNERWAPVVGHPNYEVSDLGRVRNRLTGHVQRRRPSGKGYIQASFGKTSPKQSVHRVVLRAFVGEPPPGDYQGSHLNGDCTDNRLSNLAWELRLDNMRRKHDHGTVIRGERTNTAKLTAADVRWIRSRHDAGVTMWDLARACGVSRESIGNVVRRRTWRHVA